VAEAKPKHTSDSSAIITFLERIVSPFFKSRLKVANSTNAVPIGTSDPLEDSRAVSVEWGQGTYS
jgi:hypothetical protein